MHRTLLLSLAALLLIASCKKDEATPDPTPTPAPAGPRLILKFKFDSTQVRLNNFGLPSTVPANHAAQCPKFNRMSAHYVEFAPNAFTALGAGKVLYHATETNLGGGTAIDHDLCLEVADGGEFLNLPLTALDTGSYSWLRVSLAYQNYDVRFNAFNIPMIGTIASFIGYNSYITSYTIHDSTVAVNGNRLQGYWGFEVHDQPLVPVITGQAPPGATTVVNPLFSTSPIPAGSCVVTGQFATPLHITGNETSDVVVVVSISTNNSFEWVEHGGNTTFEPLQGDTVVDMGVRGMIPIVQ